MRVVGKYAGHFDLWLGLGVRRIDDAEPGFTPCDERQGGPDILALCQARLDRGPQPQLLERRLGILAGRYSLHIAERKLAVGESSGEIGTRLEFELEARSLGGDEHESVAEQDRASAGLDQLLLVQIVHPVEIGRDEDIG